MDIHLHTPASADWLEPGTTYLQWLQKAETKGLDIVAITDHNTVEGIARLRAEIERLTWLEANDRLRPQERRDLDEYRRLGDKILVLPGFEFTATFGFHILGLFPPETPLRTLELLLLRLNVPMDRLAEGVTEVGPTTDVITAYRVIREAGGLVIAAHANSTHGVALQGMSFGGQTRIAFTQDANLHALEVTDLESASRRSTLRFFDGSKPEYPRRMHLMQGSDAHRLARDPRDKNRLGIGDRVTEIMMRDVSFDSLRGVLEGNDFSLMRPYRPPAEAPFDHVDAAREQGPNIVQAFHETMARESGSLQKILCDVVAFANTSGGTIYVGVSADKRPPRGVEAPEDAVLLLKREIERNVTPPLDAAVDITQSHGVPVLRAAIPNGTDKPYALGQTRVYVREEGETDEAVRDELVRLVMGAQRPVQRASAPVETPAPAAERGTRPARSRPPAKRPGSTPEPAPQPAPATEPVEEQEAELPAIGVELVSMEERKGSRYFAIRDLRNGNVVQNVTIHSARKLWSYAINQHLTHPDGPENVTWLGEHGLWQAARRAKKLRYDLVLRMPDGKLRVFYGVTADGMSGPWAQFLLEEDRPEGDLSAALPFVSIVEEAEEEATSPDEESMGALAPAENGVGEEPVAAKSKSRRGRRGGRGRSKNGRTAGSESETVTEEGDTHPEAAVAVPPVVELPAAPPVVEPSAEPPVVELPGAPADVAADSVPADVAAPVADAAPARKPRSRTRKPKAVAPEVAAEAAAPAPDVTELPAATPPPALPAPVAPAETTAAKTAASPKPRARTRAKKVAAPEGEQPVAESIEPAVVAAPAKRTTSTRRTPKPATSDTMPEAIGQAKPKSRTRKPKPAAEE